MIRSVMLGVMLALGTVPVRAGESCPDGQQPLQESRLFFGRSVAGGGAVTDGQFADFLKSEVVPRFPDGFTVLDGIGYWKGCVGPDATGGCERSKLAVFLYAPDAAASERITAIAHAYAARFHQEAVLRADTQACVAFLGAGRDGKD